MGADTAGEAVAVISGGSAGMGLAVAERFARGGVGCAAWVAAMHPSKRPQEDPLSRRPGGLRAAVRRQR